MGGARERFPSSRTLLAESGLAPVTRAGAPGKSDSGTPPTGVCATRSTGGCSLRSARTGGPATSIGRPAPPAKPITALCVASGPAGRASCGAADRITPPKVRGSSLLRGITKHLNHRRSQRRETMRHSVPPSPPTPNLGKVDSRSLIHWIDKHVSIVVAAAVGCAQTRSQADLHSTVGDRSAGGFDDLADRWADGIRG